ncbi:hypothetical protein [uncultured Pseudoflavonifractor sp.]|uniref:hypothetical protein n=1 Tax=uncultured Pseudoflavonifractor sp. TaxID=1221379 RepID=UPI0025FDC3A5|nr:hypothetical protein [uncultured Pseudoflavonifractor sp.]
MNRPSHFLTPLFRLGVLLFCAGTAGERLSLLPGGACAFLCGAGAALGLWGLFLRAPLARPLRAWKSNILRRF